MIYFFCAISICLSILGLMNDDAKMIRAGIVVSAMAPLLGAAVEAAIKMLIP